MVNAEPGPVALARPGLRRCNLGVSSLRQLEGSVDTARWPSGDPGPGPLYAEPFRLSARRARPCLLSSPRPIPGASIPPACWQAAGWTPLTLRRSEDAFVDELFAGVVGAGRAPDRGPLPPRLSATSTAASGELDAGMFDAPLGMPVDAPSPRVPAGLGVIPRIVRDGAEIYRGKLDAARSRCAAAASSTALSSRRWRRWWRKPSRASAWRWWSIAIPCRRRCRCPISCWATVMALRRRAALTALGGKRLRRAQAFSMARNAPYAGGYTTLLYGRARRRAMRCRSRSTAPLSGRGPHAAASRLRRDSRSG